MKWLDSVSVTGRSYVGRGIHTLATLADLRQGFAAKPIERKKKQAATLAAVFFSIGGGEGQGLARVDHV
jgi:hypothetical protein